MGEIQAGDKVYDEAGAVCNVIWSSPVMHDHPVYEVEFDQGLVIKADHDHQWKTITHTGHCKVERLLRQKGFTGKDTFTTSQIRDTLFYNKTLKTPTHSVPVCAIQGEEIELPIHPYVLGCWLGDGCSSAGQFTCDDPEIVEAIRGFGYEVSKHKDPISYGIKGLLPALRAFGISGSTGVCKKAIPRLYQKSSLQQRLWLLKGLLDTDGHAAKDGSAEFYSTHLPLARDAWELINGLGLKAAWGEGKATINGRYISPKYRIRFVANFPVFHLRRKAERQKGGTQGRNLKRYIVDVRPCDSVPVKCIAVDSPSNLYLVTDSFVPTHNTFVGLQKSLYLLAKYPKNEWMFARMRGSDLEKTLIPEFFKQCPESWIARVHKRGQTGQVVHLKNGSIAYFQHIRDASALGTKTRRTGHNLGGFLVEQAEEITREEWVSLNGRLRNPNAKVRFALGNANPAGRDWIFEDFFAGYAPLDPANKVFYRSYVRGNRLGIHVDSLENRKSNGGFVDDGFFDNYISNSPPEFVRRYIHASFENFSGKVYSEYTLDSVHNIEPLPRGLYDGWECVGGIDVGGSCPWGVVDVRVDPWGNLVVVGEFAEATPVAEQVARWIRSNMPYDSARTTFVIDPENKVAADDLSRMGIYCRVAEKHVFAGTLRVASYLHLDKTRRAPDWLEQLQPELARRIEREGCPRMFFVNSCSKTRLEHDRVVWDEKWPNQIKKTATERYDLCDATRYIVATRPEPTKLPPVDRFSKLRAASPLSAMEAEEDSRLIAAWKAKQRGAATAEMFMDGTEMERTESGLYVPVKWDWD